MARPPRPELRHDILVTAAVEFARLGYARVSIDQVAAQLGVTKGAVYLHFRGKMEVFLRTLDDLEALREDALVGAPTDALGALRHGLAARLAFHADRPELRRLLLILDTELADEPAVAARDGIRADYRALRGELRRLLQLGMRAGSIVSVDAAAEAFRLAACLEGSCAQLAASTDDVAHFFEPETLVESWLAPLVRSGRRKGATERAPAQSEEDPDFRPAF